MELPLVVDEPLAGLPWGDPGAEIAVLLTHPVLQAVDKLKKGTERTRGRALAWSTKSRPCHAHVDRLKEAGRRGGR